ncbi:MAG: FadR family transcriptional regulator [Bacteroidetes bacterium]|nr:FadR family transcriptional regulator [Bacteroidota bacterium]
MSFNSIGKRETLPEKVAKTIKEAILHGEMQGGEALPTEPELEKEFGVSRAVIRDAMRMLKAQGLIDVKHGKGMFVSFSQTEAFTDALLTSLRRDNASAWDVEQFEQLLLPQIIALASTEATDNEIQSIKSSADKYLKSYEEMINQEEFVDENQLLELQKKSRTVFVNYMRSIFESTHNKLIMLLGDVLIDLRKWRTVSDVEESLLKMIDLEKTFINLYVKAIETRNPEKASRMVQAGINYDSSMVSIMKVTPIGESPEIPGEVFFSSYKGTEDKG